MDKTEILRLVKTYDLSPTKALGQNFLMDDAVVSKIIIAAEVNAQTTVVEIGPGLGVLTRPLLEVAKRVIAYEIDPQIVALLNHELIAKNLKLIHANALHTPFLWTDRRTLVSNVPYNITSDILFKIFASAPQLDLAVIMLQKEVVMRLLAKPGDSDYSRLTLTASHFAKAELVTMVPATSFWPQPNVDSAVVKLHLKPINYELSLPLLKFFDLAFSQRRKTLINNLKIVYTIEDLTTILTSLNLSLKVRPQELSYDVFCAIFKALPRR